MATALEAGVYLIVFLVAMVTTLILLYARRKFLPGEFRDFIDAVIASAMAFFLGSGLNLAFIIYSNTVFGPALLIVTGFSFLLTSLFFIKAAFKLHQVSKVFGFADLIEKDFEKAHEAKKKKPSLRRRRR